MRTTRRLDLEKKDRYGSYIIYAGLFIICILTFDFWFRREHLPYAWIADGVQQHYVALQYIRDYQHMIEESISGGNSFRIPHFSYTLGQGADVITTLNAYDFLDPISWMTVALFPHRLTRSYKLMVWIKLFLAGETFCLYSNCVSKANGWWIALGAVIYSFSVETMNITSPNFMHGFYLLPLMLWGIEVSVRKTRNLPLILIVFYSVLTNYYCFYSNTVMCAIYLLVRLWLKKNTRRENLRKCSSVVLSYLVGACLSGAILFPSIYAFLNNCRTGLITGYTDSWLWYPLKFYKQLFVYLGKFDGLIDQQTFIGTIPICLICLILMLTRHDRQWRLLKVLTVGIILSMCIPICGLILNGFGYAANRWTYSFALVLAMIYIEIGNKLCDLKKSQLMIITLITIVYECCTLWMKYHGSTEYLYDVTNPTMQHVFGGYLYDALLVATILILWMVNIFPIKKYGNFIIGEVTILSVIISITAFLSPIDGDFIHYFERANSIEAELRQTSIFKMHGTAKDEEFYRIEKRESDTNVEGNNQVRGTTFWWSIMSKDLYKYCTNLQLNTIEQNCNLKGLDGRRALLDLAAVKYYTTDSKNSEGVPVGYKKVKEGVYENKHYLGSAFLYDNYIRKENLGKNPLEMQESMLQGIVLDQDVPNTRSITPEKRMTSIPYKIETKNLKISNHQIDVKKEKGAVTLYFKDRVDRELYVWINGLKINDKSPLLKSAVWCRGQIKGKEEVISDYEKRARPTSDKDWWYVPIKGITYYIGGKRYGYDSVKIVFEKKGKYDYKSLNVYANNTEKYMEDISKLTPCRNISIGTDEISGSVQCDKNQVLFLSVPYSRGWSAKVDGKKVTVLKANGMYMAIPLSKGNHAIELNYVTPFLRIGMVSSIVTLMGIILFKIKQLRKRKQHYPQKNGGRT